MNQEPRRTVFHNWHKTNGAHLVNFAGWEMPLNYGPGIVEEHLATRKFGGLFDVSHMGRFLIKGEDALSFLQYMLTNNAAALEPGRAQYTILADERGGAIDDAYLYCLEEKEYLLVVNASNAGKDLLWLREHLKKYPGVTLEDQTVTLAMAAFQGPQTREILGNLVKETGTRLPDPARNNLRKSVIEDVPVIISRTGYTGEPLAFELFMPAEGARKVWEKIIQTGKGEGVIPVGLGARDTLRLEAGLPLYGHEFGMDADGKEIPILAVPKAKVAISFSEVKGDYIGKNALWNQFQELKSREEGQPLPLKLSVPHRFYSITLLSEGIARQSFPVYIGQEPAGYVSSGTMVPYWKFRGEGIASTITDETGRRAIALAYLPAGLKENQPVRVQSRGKFLEGIVVKRHIGAEFPPYARPILSEEAAAAQLPPSEPLEVAVESLVKRAQANSRWRQKQTINLIPSEQTPSLLVKLLSVADPCARYAEHRHLKPLGDSRVYYYQGTDFIEWVEERLREEMSRYLGCSEVETRIISGQMANATVFSGLVDYLNRFDRKSNPRRLRKVMNHHLGRGGHLSSQPMGALRDFIAVDPQTEAPGAVNFPVLEENPYEIDLKKTEELLHQHKPELLVLGRSMVLHREPLVQLRRMVDSLPEKPIIMYDMAHVLGLIGPLFQKPFQEGADIVTGSTHKTFFGTQRGIIGSNFGEGSDSHDLWMAITRRTFPGSLSNHHLGTLLGLLAAAYEMNAFAGEYQKQVMANAKAFARALKAAGLRVEGDPNIQYTETHQVLLRVGYGRGPETARWLEKNNIVVNYQALPDDEGFSVSSGLRMGVQEMTRFGMKEKDFEVLAGIMADLILRDQSAAEEIRRLRSRFTVMQYCLSPEKANPLLQELLPCVVPEL